MNPFRPSQPEDVTEQDLLALHLNELPPARAAAVRRIVAADSALSAESASIAAALAVVTLSATAANRSPMALDKSTLDRNWQALHPQLGPYTPISARWHLPAFAAGLLAVAAAALVFHAYSHRSASRDFAQPKSRNEAISTNPTPPTPNDRIFTATQNGQADVHSGRSGIGTNLSSGVYRSKFHSPGAPIPLIVPAGPFGQPLLALASPPSLTLAPHFSLLAATPTQDQSQPPTGPSQTLNSVKPGQQISVKPRHTYPLDVMLGVGGTFIPEHDSLTAGTEPRTLTVTHAIVAIGSLHQQFRPTFGYRVTLSYTRPEFGYTYSSAPSATPGTRFAEGGSINSRIFEAAGTYVIQGPHHKRLTTSADAGGAIMAFLPSSGADPSTSYSFRGAGVLGVNLDYAITKHIGARLGYRAQLFRSPNFRYSGGIIPVATPIVVDHEPSLGVTYTFGKR